MKKYNSLVEIRDEALWKGLEHLYLDILEMITKEEKAFFKNKIELARAVEKRFLEFMNEDEDRNFLTDEGVKYEAFEEIGTAYLLTLVLRHLLNKGRLNK